MTCCGPVKVFACDFDRTMIAGCSGSTAIRVVFGDMDVRLSLKQINELLPHELPKVSEALLKPLVEPLRAMFAARADAGEMQDRSKWFDADRTRAGAMVWHLYDVLESHVGAMYAYKWLTCWLGGRSESDLEAFGRRTAEVGERVGIHSEEIPLALGDRWEKVRWTWGMARRPATVALCEAYAAKEVRTTIVTASLAPVVRGVVQAWKLPVHTVVGQQMPVICGVWQPDLAKMTALHDATKVSALKAQHPDHEIVAAAGDSLGDVGLLGLPTVQTQHVIHTNSKKMRDAGWYAPQKNREVLFWGDDDPACESKQPPLWRV